MRPSASLALMMRPKAEPIRLAICGTMTRQTCGIATFGPVCVCGNPATIPLAFDESVKVLRDGGWTRELVAGHFNDRDVTADPIYLAMPDAPPPTT